MLYSHWLFNLPILKATISEAALHGSELGKQYGPCGKKLDMSH
jgi:hypothetical protein